MYWFEIIIENSTFTDIDNETQTLVWNATFEGDYNLPTWLSFENYTLSGYGEERKFLAKLFWFP